MKEVMSTAQILSLVSTISFIVAVVSLAVAIFLWFWFRIPTVIGDLSGKNAQKSIARMRASNEKSGNKSFRTSHTNEMRGKVTGMISETSKSSKKAKEPKKKDDVNPETGLLEENKAASFNSEATALLVDNDATGMLSDDNETSLLTNEFTNGEPAREGGKKLIIHEDIMLIHTEEVI